MKRYRTNRRPGNQPMSGEVLSMVMEAKQGACVACYVRWQQGLLADERIVYQNDWNHCKSGNIRRGHIFGYACCPWHHRAHPIVLDDVLATRTIYGPSLMDGGKTFAASFGSDDFLINTQRELLGVDPLNGLNQTLGDEDHES